MATYVVIRSACELKTLKGGLSTNLYTTFLLPTHLHLSKFTLTQSLTKNVLAKSSLLSPSITSRMILSTPTPTSTAVLHPFFAH